MFQNTEQGPSRLDLLEKLDGQLSACSAKGDRLALLVFNLQRFRAINIDLGYEVGDALLQQITQRISGILRPGDMLFHVGNDEFAVVLSELKSSQVVRLAAERILDALGRNYEISGQVLAITVVAGVAVFPDHADDLRGLLRAADTALYAARDQQLPYSIYDTSLKLNEQHLAKLKGNLRNALDNSELMLYYQPQVDLQRGTLSGCEALIRWLHPEEGWMKPDQFIPVAEKSTMIDSLTYWSINVALREWFQFSGAGSSTSISINLSAKVLHSPEVVGLISRAMNIWGVEAGGMVLEVTESAMMSDPVAALSTLRDLHGMGITLSIDDFGTGYSSLSYLKKLPVGELKIDKSFVQHMAEDPQDRKIVQSIIDLAHNLEMGVVAEGIENQQTLDMLIGMGCDYGQGFHIGRPMPIAELPSWLENSKWIKLEKLCS